MATELYVGNLPMSMTEDALRNLFLPHGAVTEVHFRLDRTRREPHRFAFVTMAAQDGASAAIFALNGREMQGLELRVTHSRPPGERATASSDGTERRRGPRR